MGQGIPASLIVGGQPGVIGVGGSGLQFSGMFLTTSWRVPTGTVQTFGSQAAVAAFFGGASLEAQLATYYFAGFTNSTLKPAAMLFAQYAETAAVTPYLQGGNISGLTLAQLQTIAPGALGITINGVAHTSSSINLATATSFSNAATIIAAALGINDAAFTGVLAPETASVTGSITGTVLDATVIGSGVLVVGGILAGTGVTAGTKILAQLTGAAGGVGTYQVSASQSVTSTTITETYAQLTASSITGALDVGQIIAGAGVTAGSVITAPISANVWVVSPSQTVGSEAMTAGAATVAYDSTSGAFVINGGTPGTPGTIGYGSGAIATALLLTLATGAVLSQGAPLSVPGTFMTAIVAITQNWFSLVTEFDPGTSAKVAFAQWVSQQNTKYAYQEWASEVANAQPSPTLATAQIIAAGYSGTVPIYAPATGAVQAAAAAGMLASIDFNQEDGRENFAFLNQIGLPVEVTSGTVAEQLSTPPGPAGSTNGFNYYGNWTTRANAFNFFYPGSITGPYNWLDSYYCAAWLDDQLAVAQMDLFTTVGDIPFTQAGAEVIYNALAAGPVAAAISFGAINIGVELSQAEVSAVAAIIGFDISSILATQGWYLQVNVPPPSIRQTRGPWPIILVYTDAGSCLTVTIDPLAVQ